MAEEIGKALGWDDEIEGTGEDRIIFEPGVYAFEVIDFKRGQFKGSAKMAASPMATLTLKLTDPYGQETQLTYNLILNEKMRYRLSEFFVGVGLIPENIDKNEKWSPKWNQTPGARGYTEIGHREYNGNTYMDVKKILKPSEATAHIQQTLANATQPQPQPVQTPTLGQF